jgi:PPK2 family polyphosphate:nucleotide phosphotransferase
MAPAVNEAAPTADGRISELLRVRPGRVDLRSVDPSATPGLGGGRSEAEADWPALSIRLAELQEKLFAEGRSGGHRSVLLVLQGMDTSGKGGVLRRVVGAVDPQGVQIAAFKRPSQAELDHHFLWRIRKRLPDAGMIGVFDRSHYEDVVVARVRELVPAHVWRGRYDEINHFEDELRESGTRLIKCLLHISREESRARLLARLDDPAKHWKYAPGDVDERERWDAYLDAYQAAIERCGAGVGGAPWHIVPADRKWYRNWAIARLLIDELENMELAWPPADFDVESERRRLLAQP